jgi:hypothetical protein
MSSQITNKVEMNRLNEWIKKDVSPTPASICIWMGISYLELLVKLDLQNELGNCYRIALNKCLDFYQINPSKSLPMINHLFDILGINSI